MYSIQIARSVRFMMAFQAGISCPRLVHDTASINTFIHGWGYCGPDGPMSGPFA
jgi:hypothetical protein